MAQAPRHMELPQRPQGMTQAPKPMELKCGSWLACEGGVSVDELVN